MNENIKKIHETIHKLNFVSVDLKDNSNQIDVDYCINKTLELYDALLSLKNALNDNKLTVCSEVSSVESVEDKPIQKEEKKKTSKKPEVVKPVKEEIVEKPKQEKKKIVETIEKLEVATKTEEPVVNIEDLVKTAQKIHVAKSIKIGLNDKLEVVRELFAGNKQNYEKFIESIQTMSSYSEVLDFIKVKCNWDKENETANRFKEILKHQI